MASCPQSVHRASAARNGGATSDRRGALASDIAGIAVYFVVHTKLRNPTLGLAIAAAIPAVWTAVEVMRHRRLEPIGALSVSGFAGAIAITALAHGSSIGLKLDKAAVAGLVGVVLVVSVMVRRPLLAPVVDALRSAGAPAVHSGRSSSVPGQMRPGAVATLLAGAVALLDAAVQVVLAATLSTGAFILIGSIARWTILGVGGAFVVRYVRHANRV